MKIFITAALILSSVFLGQKAKADVCDAPGNLVANCGFETGDLTGWTLQSPASQAGNWYGVDNYDAETGSYGAYLAGFGSYDAGLTRFAFIGQRVPTVIGQQYFVTYDWAHNTSADPSAVPDNFFALEINGSLVPSSAEINVGSQGFLLSRSAFYATSSTTLVEFQAEDANAYFSLDNIYLATVPEPASLALVALAMSGLSIVRLSRRARS